MTAIYTDTKHKIIAAAAKLFFQNGYDKTTLRMIAEQVGITHVSILNYFDSKIEIAAKTIADYIMGLQKKCNELINEMPSEITDEEHYLHLMWWTLHFKLLRDNPSFRKLYISFNREGPLVLTQAIHSGTAEDFHRIFITYPSTDVFISRSLVLAIDANLANLMDLNVIDCVQATKIIMRQAAAAGIVSDFTLDEDDIALFAKTYISDIKIDILNDFLLPRNE